MLIRELLLAVLFPMLFGLPLSGGVRELAEKAQDGEEIVVTGLQLQATKIDYRLRGHAVLYCGPRDKLQNASAVAAICGFLESCAMRGTRSREALADCVEARIAVEQRRGK